MKNANTIENKGFYAFFNDFLKRIPDHFTRPSLSPKTSIVFVCVFALAGKKAHPASADKAFRIERRNRLCADYAPFNIRVLG